MPASECAGVGMHALIEQHGRPSRLGSLHLALLGTLGVAAACVGPHAPGVVALPQLTLTTQDLAMERHTLAVGDEITVVFPYREAAPQELVVRTDGRVTLPRLGEILAAGRSPEEVQQDIRDRYAALTTAEASGQREYRLAVGDQVEVRFRSASELNVTVPVRPDGRITLERIGSVMAEGRRPEALQEELRAVYAQFLREPDLVVIVREFVSHRSYADGRMVGRSGAQYADAAVSVRRSVPRQVYVTGEVRTPGFVAYQAPLTLLQAVVASGGPIRSAELRGVLILRKVGTEMPTATFVDLQREMRGQGTTDVPLRPFDIVIVPKTRIARLTDVVDQYLYQLIPATRNVNFTYFYDLGSARLP